MKNIMASTMLSIYRHICTHLCFLSLSILLFFSSCFDYHEHLVLNKNLSGNVKISYTVDANKNNVSLVSFLPTSKSEIEEHYSYLIEGKIARLNRCKD